MRSYLVVLTALSLALAGCGSQKDWWGWPREHWKDQDFKPYLKSETHAFPTAYGNESWAYPEGTPTNEIIQRWKEAGLVSSVTTGGRRHIWSSAARHDGAYPVSERRGRDEGSCSTSACAKQSDWQSARPRVREGPIQGRSQAFCEQRNVEDIESIRLFVLRQQIEQQSGKSGMIEGFRHIGVARTEPA